MMFDIPRKTSFLYFPAHLSSYQSFFFVCTIYRDTYNLPAAITPNVLFIVIIFLVFLPIFLFIFSTIHSTYTISSKKQPMFLFYIPCIYIFILFVPLSVYFIINFVLLRYYLRKFSLISPHSFCCILVQLDT